METFINSVTNQILTKSTNQTLTNLVINDTTKASFIKHLVTNKLLYTEHVTPNPVKSMAERATLLKAQMELHRATINGLKQRLNDLVEIGQDVEITGKKVRLIVILHKIYSTDPLICEISFHMLFLVKLVARKWFFFYKVFFCYKVKLLTKLHTNN